VHVANIENTTMYVNNISKWKFYHFSNFKKFLCSCGNVDCCTHTIFLSYWMES